MAEKKRKPKMRVPTPRGVAAYAWIDKPDTGKQYSDDKYKLTLVLDGDADLSKVREVAIKAFREEFPDVDISDDEIILSIRDGDDHKNEEFGGKLLLIAKSKFKPDCIDSKRQPLKKGVSVRSGDEVRIVVNPYPYKKTEKVREGKKMVDVVVYGVSFQLELVQLVKKNAGGGDRGASLLDEIDDGFSNEDWEDRDTDATDREEEDEAADDADF